MTSPQNTEQLKKSAFSGSLWKFAEQMGIEGVALVVSIVLARLLTPDEFAPVGVVNIFFSFGNMLIVGGLNTALIQKKEADEKDFSSIFTVSLAASVVLYAALFSELMLSDMKIPFSRLAMCMVGGLLIPVMLSSLIRILMMEQGRAYILIPFVLAFLADIGGYFAGSFLGKHKLCPNISPKKTVEGLVGGLLASVLGMLIYCLILQLGFGFKVNYLLVLVYGLVGALAGVFGDLTFSVVKRQTDIKDYGNVFPGHGGILDRFDSVIVVAPLVEALLLLIPVVTK